MNEKNSRSIGAHLSTAGGLTKAVDRAVAIGANALQIFAGSPRGWKRRPINAQELQEFKKYAKENGIRDIFIHALYLTNLASDNKEIVQKSKKALIHDLKLGSFFDCSGVVVHVGSHQGRGWTTSRDQVRVLIKNIIDEANVTVPFLIENSAGQKGKVNSNLEEIRWLLDNVQRPQLGWCYDTCHGWAAGYKASDLEKSIFSDKSIKKEQKDLTQSHNLWVEVEQYDLWDSLRCLHINDSRDALASGRDRHDNVLAGHMDAADIQSVITQPRWKDRPLITEVPGYDGKGPDKKNIDTIKKILNNTSTKNTSTNVSTKNRNTKS